MNHPSGVSVWKTNGPIPVCWPEINHHKSSAIDCKSRSVTKIENCQTANRIQPGWKRKNCCPERVTWYSTWYFGIHGLISKLNNWWKKKKNKKKAQCFLVKTLKKMFRRSPFICEFVRYGTVLNPVLLVSSDKKNCQKHFKFLKRLWKKIFCCLPNVILQLWICRNRFKKFRVEFEEIKKRKLDNFFFQKFNIQNCKTHTFVIKLVLTLSYGQASIERQFSFNN